MKTAKHKLRDLIILLISVSGLAWWYRLWQRRQGPLVRVLCFHDVKDREWFAKTVEVLADSYHLITAADLHEQNFDKKKINVLLTFDDGYQSWVDNVLPVLEEFKIKGLFFISSGLLDVAQDAAAADRFVHDRLLLKRRRRALNWSGAQALLAAGHMIGGHTVSHPDLAKLEGEALKREVLPDRSRITEMLSVAPTDFAYPFGRSYNYSPLVREEVVKAGYTHAYTAESGFVSLKDTYTIPRTLVGERQDHRTIQRLVAGGYDILCMLRRTKTPTKK